MNPADVAQSTLPDLAPYTPFGWTGPLVVSTQFGNTFTAPTVTTLDTVYIDWAFINQGAVAVGNAFSFELMLDGTSVKTWPGPVPLDADFFTYIQDYSLGQLTAGKHTVSIVADYLNQVAESDRTNNTVSFSFTVTPSVSPPISTAAPSFLSGCQKKYAWGRSRSTGAKVNSAVGSGHCEGLTCPREGCTRTPAIGLPSGSTTVPFTVTPGSRTRLQVTSRASRGRSSPARAWYEFGET